MPPKSIPDTLEAQRKQIGPHHLKRGILFMLISSFFSTLIWLTVDEIAAKCSISLMVAARNAGGLAFTLPWMLYHGSQAFKAANFKLLFMRGFSGTVSTFLVFLALYKISLTNASLLINTSPFFIPLILRVWKKTPIDHKLWVPFCIGFSGLILILNPTANILQIGALAGLASGITFAISTTLIRMATKSEKVHTTNFYFFFFSLCLTIPFLFFDWQLDSPSLWVPLALIGIFSGMGQTFLFKALQYGKATQLSPFAYASVIYSVLFDYFINHVVPSWLEIGGILLICLGGILILTRATKKLPS